MKPAKSPGKPRSPLITVYLTAKAKRALEKVADENGRSVTAQAELWLLEKLAPVLGSKS